MLTGSIGMLRARHAASLDEPGMFGPRARLGGPTIAGTGCGQTAGDGVSAALMLRHGFGLEPEEARRMREEGVGED